MAAKRKASWLFALLALMTAPAAASVAYVPDSTLQLTFSERSALFDEDAAPVTADEDNPPLRRALANAINTSVPVQSLSETRVWASETIDPLFHEEQSPLSRALHRASADLWPEIASEPTVVTPDPMGYVDSSNMYAFCGGDPVNCSDPTGRFGVEDLKTLGAAARDFTLGRAAGVVDNVKGVLEAAAMPVTMAGTAAIDAYTNARIAVSAYQTGGVEAVKREAMIAGAQHKSDSGAQAKAAVLSLVPGVNTYNQVKTAVTAVRGGNFFEAGRSSERARFSAINDVALLTGYGALGKRLASRPAPVTRPSSYANWGGEFLDDFASKIPEPTPARPLHRPYQRRAFCDAIECAAPRTPDGYPIDQNTGEILTGEYHYGHRYGYEHRRLVREAQAKGMTQKEFNKWVNSHPEWFQIESPANNMSHRFEKPGVD